MKKNTRDRLLLPILIPVLGLAAIGVLAIGVAKVLLAIPAEGATFVALLVMLAVIVGGTLVARSKKIAAGSLALMVLAMVGMAAFAGGAVLATAGPRKVEVEDEPKEGFPVAIAAKDTQFVQTEVPGVPVGEDVLINFDNQDAAVQHNVQVFDNPEGAGDPIYEGELITGPSKIQYTLEPFEEAGTFMFQCEVHPAMVGDLIVGDAKPEKPGDGDKPESGPEEPAEPTQPTEPTEPAAPPVNLTAPPGGTNAGFAETTLTAPAGTPFTLQFDNQDSGALHNVEIFEGDSNEGTKVFGPKDDEGIVAPATVDYDIPALKPGSYFYECFYHPTTMTGTLTVQ